MIKRVWIWGLAALVTAGLITGLYTNVNEARQAKPVARIDTQSQGEVRTLQYLGKAYTLPAHPGKIVVTGALEVLEDLLALGVKPAGMMTIGGTFPAMFAEITQDAKPIGERMQPSFEAILKLKPDVILSSDKFPAGTAEQLQKIAPTIPVSHFPGDGEANLRFLGELTGKQTRAEEIVGKYRQDMAAARARLPETIINKKIVAVRIRVGNIFIYPANVFFNEILYTQLGLPVPAEIKAAKSQEIISLEKFSEMDPDYIFLQYVVSESPAHPKVIEDLQRNPIWRSMKAVKNNHVFINVVDPLIQGVSISGKNQFLNAAVEKISH